MVRTKQGAMSHPAATEKLKATANNDTRATKEREDRSSIILANERKLIFHACLPYPGLLSGAPVLWGICAFAS